MTNNYFAKLNSLPQALLKTLHRLCLLISRMNTLAEACWAVCVSHICLLVSHIINCGIQSYNSYSIVEFKYICLIAFIAHYH